MPARIRKAVLDDSEAISLILREVGWFEHMKSESYEMTSRRVAELLQLALDEKSVDFRIKLTDIS